LWTIGKLGGSPRTSPYTFFSPTSFIHHTFVVRLFQKQVTIDQMITACTLERFFIKEGKYPESLIELVPIYLNQIPLDRMDSKAMRYSRKDDGRYRINSIGWNLVDDDGDEYIGRGKTLDVGDWVWQYSP
jgi:hypothetical protein